MRSHSNALQIKDLARRGMFSGLAVKAQDDARGGRSGAAICVRRIEVGALNRRLLDFHHGDVGDLFRVDVRWAHQAKPQRLVDGDDSPGREAHDSERAPAGLDLATAVLAVYDGCAWWQASFTKAPARADDIGLRPGGLVCWVVHGYRFGWMTANPIRGLRWCQARIGPGARPIA